MPKTGWTWQLRYTAHRETGPSRSMPVSVKVKHKDPAVQTQRETAVHQVIARFTPGLPNSQMLCFFDDEDPLTLKCAFEAEIFPSQALVELKRAYCVAVFPRLVRLPSSSRAERQEGLSPRSVASRIDQWQRGYLPVGNEPGSGSEGRGGGVSGSCRLRIAYGGNLFF